MRRREEKKILLVDAPVDVRVDGKTMDTVEVEEEWEVTSQSTRKGKFYL